MIARCCAVVFCALALSVSETEAQARDCFLNSRPGGVLTRISESITTATLPIITCEGGLSITANTANYMPGRIDLYQNVTVRDSARTLTADQVVFFNQR